MKTKKTISLCIVFALIFCMSVNAFAAEMTPDNDNTSEATNVASGSTSLTSSSTKADIIVGSKLYVPTIEVQISNPAGIVVNPYGMDWDNDSTTPNDSLISTGSLITNKTKLPMKISAAPKAVKVPESKVEYATGSLAGKDLTAPTIYLNLGMAKFSAAANATTWTSPTDATEANVTFEDCSSPASISLGASDGSTHTYGGYKFSGESGGTNWTNKDLIKVTVTFAIEPVIGS